MADQLLELTVKVNAETGQLDIVSQKMKGLSEEAGKAGKSVGEAGVNFGALAKAFGGLASAAAVGSFFKSAVQGAEEENQAMRRLKFAVEAAGGSFDSSQKQIDAWAKGIQAATRFTDGQAIDTMSRFVRVTGDTVQAQKASQLAMSLSVATGKDLGTTTEILTNIINKNERGIAMARREFGAFIGGAETGQQVLDILSAKLGDTALKEAGFSKETASLSNNWNELKDTVGNFVIPALTVLTGWLNKGVDAVRAVGDALAATAAAMLISAETIGKAVIALARRDFASLAAIAKDGWTQISAITQESGEMIRQEFDKTTAAHAVHIDTRIQQSQRLTDKEKADLETVAADREADAQRALEMTADLERQILALKAETLPQKQAILDKEISIEREKINRTIQNERAKQTALATLDRLQLARTVALQQAEVKVKREMAFQTVDSALQTLSIINSMQSSHTKAQVTRARAILALEKAIAIARIWSTSAGAGPGMVALATAQTALVAAQFAQQSKAIGEASKVADQGSQELRVSTDLGNGQTLSNVSTTGAGTQGIGGVSSGAGAPGAAVAGTGGNIINVGGVVVNFSADSVDLSQMDTLLRRVADAVLRGTTEGVQLAIAVKTVGDKNAGVAR